jgi:hypothetical protein
MSSNPLTPEQRSMRARLAAHTLHSRVDGAQHTAPARAAFMDRFEKQVDPHSELDPAERARRAEHAKKAYFTGLSLKSARRRPPAGERQHDARKRPEGRLSDPPRQR